MCAVRWKSKCQRRRSFEVWRISARLQCPRETRRCFPVFLLTGTRGATIFGGRGDGRCCVWACVCVCEESIAISARSLSPGRDLQQRYEMDSTWPPNARDVKVSLWILHSSLLVFLSENTEILYSGKRHDRRQTTVIYNNIILCVCFLHLSHVCYYFCNIIIISEQKNRFFFFLYIMSPAISGTQSRCDSYSAYNIIISHICSVLYIASAFTQCRRKKVKIILIERVILFIFIILKHYTSIELLHVHRLISSSF